MNKPRQTLWLVHTPGEGIPGPYIPTLGHPASASDLFRVAALHTTGHEGWNSCLTDFSAPAALGRLIEGGVTSVADLQAAELALQALMWHERVDVLVPAFKLRQNGLAGYARETDPRTQIAFDLFEDAAAYDQFFVVEEVSIEDGIVASSNVEASGILGHRLEDAKATYLHRSPYQVAVLSSVPQHFGVPAYFTHPLLRPYSGKRGFFGQFYTSVARDWDKMMSVVPDINEVVNVPPLTAIVLDRASRREDLPAIIRDLRQELTPVRDELVGFGDMVRGAYTQVQIEHRCRDIQASFDAVVRASRYRAASFLLPLVKLYKAAKSPLDPLISALNPEYTEPDPRVLADRTCTTRAFAKLLRVDSMHSLLANILTDAELQSLNGSASSHREA